MPRPLGRVRNWSQQPRASRPATVSVPALPSPLDPPLPLLMRRPLLAGGTPGTPGSAVDGNPGRRPVAGPAHPGRTRELRRNDPTDRQPRVAPGGRAGHGRAFTRSGDGARPTTPGRAGRGRSLRSPHEITTGRSGPGDLTVCRQHDTPSVSTDIEDIPQTTYGSFASVRVRAGKDQLRSATPGRGPPRKDRMSKESKEGS